MEEARFGRCWYCTGKIEGRGIGTEAGWTGNRQGSGKRDEYERKGRLRGEKEREAGDDRS